MIAWKTAGTQVGTLDKSGSSGTDRGRSRGRVHDKKELQDVILQSSLFVKNQSGMTKASLVVQYLRPIEQIQYYPKKNSSATESVRAGKGNDWFFHRRQPLKCKFEGDEQLFWLNSIFPTMVELTLLPHAGDRWWGLGQLCHNVDSSSCPLTVASLLEWDWCSQITWVQVLEGTEKQRQLGKINEARYGLAVEITLPVFSLQCSQRQLSMWMATVMSSSSPLGSLQETSSSFHWEHFGKSPAALPHSTRSLLQDRETW